MQYPPHRLPYDSGTVAYDLKKQARCIVALEGDTDNNSFLLASLSLHGDNEVHVLEFNEDTNEVWCPLVYSHPHEVWSCTSCPAAEHTELLFTTHSNGSEQRTHLWRMDGLAEREAALEAPQRTTPKPRPMTELLQLGDRMDLNDSCGVLWNAVLPETVASVHRKTVKLWRLSHATAASSAAEAGSASTPGESATFGCGRWDPHHAHSLGLGCQTDLFTLDTRNMKMAVAVKGAHEQKIRGIDYNPNKPNTVLSHGDDYHIHFWDLRKTAAPLQSHHAHSHWVTSASYNRFHDQLVLTSGTDSKIKLWRAATISSSPPAFDPDDPEPVDADADGLVREYNDHEQSVFSAVWCAADAWIFASVSLDGKAVISHVPPSEKYKILL